MKSLNRTLSLVLVLAMCLGLMGVASASFTDASKIQYTEAVSVMTGIGAINGYTDGTFAPTATITREEAAKMITYAILGPTVAAKLSVTATGFSDVDAARWSAPYIGYCVSAGIINGMGDGTFAPTANVTGYQIAKMMLCAAGYGKKGEYTGTSWELNVAVDANKNSIFSGAKTASYSAAATREEAALYVFNAITKTPTVSYSKLTEEYTKYSVANPAAANDEAILDDNCYQIAENVYTTLTKSTAGADLFGRPGSVWYLANKAISSAPATAVATYTGVVSASTVAADLNGYTLPKAGGTFLNVENGTTYTNGGTGFNTTAIVNANGAGAVLLAVAGVASETIAKALADETADGKLVQIYANTSKQIIAIIETTFTVASITNVVTTSTSTIYTIGGNPYTDYVDDNLYSDTIAGNTGMAMMLTLQQPTLMHTSLLLWVLSQLYMATHFLTPQFLSRFSPLQTTQ